MTRFERLVRLDGLMRSRRPVPMHRLTEALEVSRSTITRDIEYLRDRLLAPVVYDRDANGHWYDPEAKAFELPGFWMNQSELYGLLATEQLLESIQPGVLGPHLGPLKGQVRKLLGEAGQSAERIGERIRLHEAGRRVHDSAEFSTFAEAVLTGRCLEIEYHSRSRDERSHRHVHPQRLMHYRSNWYLIAHCETAGELRMFSLDRIREAKPLRTEAMAIDSKRVDRWLGASYGIFTGTADAWAHLRFTETAARWVAEERWHPDQLGTWVDGEYELQVPYADPTELIREVLQYGPEVEVLGPRELRQEVARRLAAAAKLY